MAGSCESGLNLRVPQKAGNVSDWLNYFSRKTLLSKVFLELMKKEIMYTDFKGNYNYWF